MVKGVTMKITCSKCNYSFMFVPIRNEPGSTICPQCGNKITLTDVKKDRMLNSTRDKTIITK
jgi:uncharacterized Zn finger protein (UPF0148 family)